jgi:hypothetical protein
MEHVIEFCIPARFKTKPKGVDSGATWKGYRVPVRPEKVGIEKSCAYAIDGRRDRGRAY